MSKNVTQGSPLFKYQPIYPKKKIREASPFFYLINLAYYKIGFSCRKGLMELVYFRNNGKKLPTFHICTLLQCLKVVYITWKTDYLTLLKPDNTCTFAHYPSKDTALQDNHFQGGKRLELSMQCQMDLDKLKILHYTKTKCPNEK